MRYFIVCIMLISSLLHAQNNQELFLHGNELYQQGEFQEALEKYSMITNPGYGVMAHSAHAYYMLGDPVRALLYFKKAYAQAQGKDARALEQRIGELEYELGIASQQALWFTYAYRLFKRFSLTIWQLLLLALCWILFFTFLYYRHRKIVCGLLLLATIVYGWSLYFVNTYNTAQRAIVFTQTVLHSGKDNRLTTGTTLKQGEEIIVLEQRDPWYKVQYNFSTGWVRRDTFEFI